MVHYYQVLSQTAISHGAGREFLLLTLLSCRKRLTSLKRFYIALPFGGLTLAMIVFSFKPPQSSEHDDKTLKEKLMEFDYLGMFLFFPCVTCLLLALQWGGTVHPWNSGRVIALLVVFGVLAVAFVGVQIWKGDKAALPPRLMKTRNVAFACLYAACSKYSPNFAKLLSFSQ